MNRIVIACWVISGLMFGIKELKKEWSYGGGDIKLNFLLFVFVAACLGGPITWIVWVIVSDFSVIKRR